jgi:hypothetical protein
MAGFNFFKRVLFKLLILNNKNDVGTESAIATTGMCLITFSILNAETTT